jgi:phospholipid/cholesterol/gamma-HCH transport system permease protein
MSFLTELGRFSVFIHKVFSKPEKFKLTLREFKEELSKLGINSIAIVVIISFFIGAVITLQTAYNIRTPLVPVYLVGYLVRESMLLEFSSTIVSLILAGKIGSNIASEIGTMRITEQIDALELMGVNSASYLVAPKIVAAMMISPILYIFSVFIGILGGILAGHFGGAVNMVNFIQGIQYNLNLYYVLYSVIKTIFFGFVITAIPAYYGYYVSGGALDVGKASTKAVVNSSVAVLILNLVLTQILLD